MHTAEHCILVALGIGADGAKTPLGLWAGATENQAVVTALLADLVERGLSAEGGLLAVVDGGKALAAGLKAVFGNSVLIQRCQIHRSCKESTWRVVSDARMFTAPTGGRNTHLVFLQLHKQRNVIEHLPEAERAWVGRKLDAILADTNPDRGGQAARDLAKALERKHPGTAASLREGLPELFTVARFGITGTLARTLVSSNPIESMFSIARRVNRDVSRWRDGMMVMRQAAAGIKQAAAQFRRVKDHKQMPALITALEETTRTEHTDKPVKRLRTA